MGPGHMAVSHTLHYSTGSSWSIQILSTHTRRLLACVTQGLQANPLTVHASPLEGALE